MVVFALPCLSELLETLMNNINIIEGLLGGMGTVEPLEMVFPSADRDF